MAEWLDADALTGAIGAELYGGVDAAALAVHAAAVAEHVEDRRPDLFVLDEATETMVFTPGKQVVLAAATLAYRTYSNRTSPETELADSDDLAAMLGIGKHRRFRFGGAAPLTPLSGAAL